MIPLGPVVARSRTKASRASVWAHLTDSSLRSHWWQALEFEPGLGGAVRSIAVGDGDAEAPQTRELEGTIDVWVAGHALGFTWQVPGEDRGTAVLITLRSQGYHTGVTVTETGFDALPEGAVRADAAGRDWGRFAVALTDASLAEVEPAKAGTQVGAGVAAAAVGAVAADATVGAVNDTSEIELAPVEFEGELAAAAAEDAPIEVDAEPNVGDHLELVTGPIEIPGEEGRSEGIVPLVLPEPHEIPLVLPEPPGNIMTGAPATADDETEEPEEPDFDSLLRGLL